ncbi:MAG: FG-GAP repeat protein [Acidimicrobiia bacterium]|nr:FG-GAP repeat protein [Acidimicrobiia bacterium]
MKRRARPLIFFSVLLLLGAAISRLAAQGSAPDMPMPGPHDPAEAARAGQLAGPAPGSASPNTPTARQYAAQIPGPPGPGAQPQVPWATYRVFATRYDPNTAGSVEVAVPDKCVKFAALGDTATLNSYHCGPGYPVGLDYRVLITRDNGQSMYIPVKDVGPWNIDDNYWDPSDSTYPRPRRMFGDLNRGTPESQAAYYNGYNTVSNCKNLDNSLSGHSGGADQFGRCVLNPSAVDISTAAAQQLGFSGAEWVTASFLWEPLDGILAFPYGFRGGVFTAAGDFNGDGKPEVVAGADAGGGPQVTVYSAQGAAQAGFFPYPTGFQGGTRVAAGRFGSSERIVTAPGPSGGPQVLTLSESGAVQSAFWAYAQGFTGGVYVASGNVDGTGGGNIVTGADRGGGPQVRVFRPDGTPISSFFAYGTGFGGGVRVATGDVNGDGTDEIITGAGPSGGPQVRIFRADGTPIGGFFAYGEGFHGGIYVGTVRSPDNKTDWIVTGAGEGGGTQVRIFKADGTPVGGFFLDNTTNGVRVAGGNFTGAAPGQLALSEGPGSVPLVHLRRTDGTILYP